VQKSWAGTVGAQAGYNWGTCNTIFGIEVDGNWVSGRTHTQLIPNVPFFNININSTWDTLVTGRARAGLVIDNMLLYVTGGVAAGRFHTNYFSAINIPNVINITNQANTEQWRYGLAAGVGAEWALGNNWTLRSEVLYVDFVESSHRVLFIPAPAPGTFASFKESDSAWITRIGVNYKFGGGAVVARY
jgi:outer membrane immunogenic protein